MNQNKVLAVVGGKTITDADVQKALINMGPRAEQYNNPQGKQILLEQLINKELILIDAKKNLLEHDAEFKVELEKLKKELLANFYVEKFLRDVKVKDEEIREYFDSHQEEFKGEETVEASHILVESEEKANDVLSKIQSGEMTFEEAAKVFSSCPSSQRGGDLGAFGRGQMVKEFDEACFEMEIGEIRGPVQTQFGFHLIRLNQKNEAQKATFEQVKDQLQQFLLSQAQQKAYQSKINQLKILYPVDHSGIL